MRHRCTPDDTEHRSTIPGVLPILVSVETLAAAWAVTPATVRRWAREGRVPAVKLGPREWRFRIEDLERIARDGCAS